MATPIPRVDPLALPPVPPPAPGDCPWRDRIVIALFGVALLLPLAGAIVNRGLETTLFENRRAAAWPVPPATYAAWRSWPAAFEAAFADRFGGRDFLIGLHHYATALGFGVSPVANAMIGRDGWLYFLGEDGKSIERDYRGVAPYPAEEPARVAAELKRRRDFLAALGIPYIVMIVPDKATIYPEHLPRWVTRVAPLSRLDRLYAALAAYPDVTVLDLRPALTAAKARERVYYMTDSHWNLLGATVGYQALAAAVKAVLPSFPAVPAVRPPYRPGVDFYTGDVAYMMGLRRVLREDDIAPLGHLLAAADQRCAKLVDKPFAAGTPAPTSETLVYQCDRPELPTAIVYRDSMAIALIPLLSENFRRVIYVSDRRMDRALVEREKPDVVIEEMVERTIHAPSAFPI